MAEDESNEKGGGLPMLPLILALLIMPLASMGITQFVVIPQLKAMRCRCEEGSEKPKDKEAPKRVELTADERDPKLGGRGDYIPSTS